MVTDRQGLKWTGQVQCPQSIRSSNDRYQQCCQLVYVARAEQPPVDTVAYCLRQSSNPGSHHWDTTQHRLPNNKRKRLLRSRWHNKHVHLAVYVILLIRGESSPESHARIGRSQPPELARVSWHDVISAEDLQRSPLQSDTSEGLHQYVNAFEGQNRPHVAEAEAPVSELAGRPAGHRCVHSQRQHADAISWIAVSHICGCDELRWRQDQLCQ